MQGLTVHELVQGTLKKLVPHKWNLENANFHPRTTPNAARNVCACCARAQAFSGVRACVNASSCHVLCADPDSRSLQIPASSKLERGAIT